MKKFLFIIFILFSNSFLGQVSSKGNFLEIKEIHPSDTINKKTISTKDDKILPNRNRLLSDIQNLQEVTDIGNTTNNSIILNKASGSFTGMGSVLFAGQNEFITGTTVTNFADNNRVNSNASDWTYATASWSDFSGTGSISGVVGANPQAINSGNGNAISVYANRLTSEHSGSGTTTFLIGSSVKVNATGSGFVNYARSSSSSITVDNPNIVVNYAQAMHPTVKLKQGTIAEIANILYLDYDIESLVNIQGDLSYIEAGDDGLSSFSTGGEKRFIHYRGDLKSDFNGIINVQNPLSDIENATDKVLVTKEYVKNELNQRGNQSPWNNTDGTTASQNSNDINYLNGNIGIGTTNTQGFKLGVNGQIAATEVKVAEYINWPDFVFKKEYDLSSLQEVEKHIQQKGHLKDIPSAKEVKENGFYLANMDAKLLQKIEELTLYLIEQEKRIKALEKKLDEIKK